MILSEISYAQVGLAVMGARRLKKKIENQQQAKTQESDEQQKSAPGSDTGKAVEKPAAAADGVKPE